MRDDWRRAVIDGDDKAVARLLAEGVNPNDRDRYGQTALMLAAPRGRDAVVELLLGDGVDLDVTAKHGLSALMLAVVNRQAAIARRLIAAGADLTLVGGGAPGFAGKTARDLAEAAGLTDLAEFIARAENRSPPSG